MKELILKTEIKAERGCMYYCTTGDDGFLQIEKLKCDWVGNRKKKEKIEEVKEDVDNNEEV
jgi:hypothetical protein